MLQLVVFVSVRGIVANCSQMCQDDDAQHCKTTDIQKHTRLNINYIRAVPKNGSFSANLLLGRGGLGGHVKTAELFMVKRGLKNGYLQWP